MKNNETENQYLLLFRDDGWYTHLSVEELEAVIGKFRTWFENLSVKGIVRGGQVLGREGRVISGNGRRSINDDPFAEAKEAIGGYLLLTADSLEEATAIAKCMPGLDYGTQVEVRPIATECPQIDRVKSPTVGDFIPVAGRLRPRPTTTHPRDPAS
jgi:hypothetical protein